MAFFKRIFLFISLLFFSSSFSLHAMIFAKEKKIYGTPVLIQQFNALRQADNCSCGLYATYNVFCFMLEEPELDMSKRLMDNNGLGFARKLCVHVNQSCDFRGDASVHLVTKLLEALKVIMDSPITLLLSMGYAAKTS